MGILFNYANHRYTPLLFLIVRSLLRIFFVSLICLPPICPPLIVLVFSRLFFFLFLRLLYHRVTSLCTCVTQAADAVDLEEFGRVREVTETPPHLSYPKVT